MNLSRASVANGTPEQLLASVTRGAAADRLWMEPALEFAVPILTGSCEGLASSKLGSTCEDTMGERDFNSDATDDDRRKFMQSFGTVAAITPPALAVLMSTTLQARASGGGARPSHRD